ncbi:MAG: hypothetical protein CMG60_08260 [Candidatus Marinimicrobia bacterium]|nr:hypothetical protein [Candidatus Neomarinimicrobiota bacterium]
MIFTDGSDVKFYEEAVSSGWVNVLYGYADGGYQEAPVLEPWHGYWLAVLEDGLQMTFPIHDEVEEGGDRNREDFWAIDLVAEIDGAIDDMMVIGYHENATDGFDQDLDAFTPPSSPAPDQVSLSISHSEWDLPLGDDFSIDIRSDIPVGSFKQWIINGESSSDEMTITWELISVPEEHEIGYSLNSGMYFADLREETSLTLLNGEQLIIRVGAQVLSLEDPTIPMEYVLEQNYPNPFNPTTQIDYGVPEASKVSVIIYDVMGREVNRLVNASKEAGYHSIHWNATNALGDPVSAGMYFYSIQAGDFVQTRKMILLK